MIRSNNPNHTSSGFTLMETLIAVAVIGFVLSSVYLLVGTALDGMSRSYGRFTQVTALKNFFVASSLEREFDSEATEATERLSNPPMDVTYEVKELPGKSSLAKYKGLKLVRARGTWRDIRGERRERLISFVFVPEEDEA